MDEKVFTELSEYSSRLNFLFKVVEDTQSTIRFLDTKAAFCVTLLTAMMAAAFQFLTPGHPYHTAHLVFLGIFGVLTLFCLTICVRVIFPTVHVQGSFALGGHAGPAFFLVPQRQRHRFLDILANKPPTGIEAVHATFVSAIMSTNDAELVRSMCDEVVTISFLRQVKSDRLHLAIQVLSATVVAFFLQLAI